MEISHHVSDIKVAILAVLSVLEVFLFGGATFGWNSLVFVLKSEKVFSDLCESRYNNTVGQLNGSFVLPTAPNTTDTNASCPEQESRFNLLFALSIAISTVGTIYIGIMTDKLGTKISRLVHTVAYVVGTLLLGFTSADMPWLVLPGMILIGLGGFALLLSSMKVAVLLRKGSAVYTGLINGSMDSSVVTFLIVKILYENGVSQLPSFIGVLVCFLLVSTACTILHISMEHKKKVKKELPTSSISSVSVEQYTQEETKTYRTSPQNTNQALEAKQTRDPPTKAVNSVISADFLMHMVWASINTLSFIFFLGSANALFERLLGSKNEISYYTNVLGYIMACGIIVSTIPGGFQEWQNMCFRQSTPKRRLTLPLIAPLGITSILSVLLSVLTFVRATEVLYASFVVLVVLRTFVFSVNMHYSITIFPVKNMTLIYGINMSILSVTNLLQYPLFIWMNAYSNGRDHVSIFLISTSVISLLHPLRLWLKAVTRDREIERNILQPPSVNKCCNEDTVSTKKPNSELSSSYTFI